jgi:hypothetical protein
LALSVPHPWGLPGIWRVEGNWERQSYSDEIASTAALQTERRRAALDVSDWRSARSRWELQTGLDHWTDRGRYGFLGGGLERRFAADSAALRVEGAGWLGRDPSGAFGTTSVSSSWQLSKSPGELVARGGVQLATRAAPLDVWPGAGTGHARAPLLRAHPLLDEGVVRGEVFGRTVVNGGIESQTWFKPTGLLRFGVAFFADFGKAWHTTAGEASDFHVDLGLGLRLKPIGDRRVFRVDAAWGLRDSDFALSVGWILPWPGWR